MGSRFTYQGRIQQAGTPLTGDCDLQFRLWDAAEGGMPVSAVLSNPAVTVTNGLFAVSLEFPPGLFDGEARWLEIAMRAPSGAGDYTILSPRQEITPGPYAIFAGGVDAGGISGTIPTAAIADGSIHSSMLAAGAVTSTKLASGAAAANLSASGQSAVPGGGIILSSNYNDGNLLSKGYAQLGRAELGDYWELRSGQDEPAPRFDHTAIWTGTEMIVWGGRKGDVPQREDSLYDGGFYRPTEDAWTAVETNKAPSSRFDHTAVWTGDEMLVWGGAHDLGILGNGGRYDPRENRWRSIQSIDAPSPRSSHTAVWTGREMIVWGGISASARLDDGGCYSPGDNSWRVVNSIGAPVGRAFHTAIWTGNEMIIWGGLSGADKTSVLNNGAWYDPSENKWTALPTEGAPSGRSLHTAVWTGTEMIVWGGFDYRAAPLNDGACYSPKTRTWRALPSGGAPVARGSHTAVWTGSEMIIWGGLSAYGRLVDAWRYDPAQNRWAAANISGLPPARSDHTAVWTGSQMIIWGGGVTSIPLGDGTFSYTPSRPLYLYVRP
jgi:N-acetylneuraminic acid mutarotase